jgi:hypothetical protein
MVKKLSRARAQKKITDWESLMNHAVRLLAKLAALIEVARRIYHDFKS